MSEEKQSDRMFQQLTADIVSCAQCGKVIDPRKVTRRGKQKPRKYCSKECFTAAHSYKELSQAGNTKQQQIKEETGHIPAYEKRREAVASSNKEKPRRHKS